MADGMERLSATWLDHQLVPQWLPALPAARDALLGGGRVADVGCGSGRALIRLAEAFPDSQFVGYDLVDAAVARATASVAAAGLAHRVTICRHDVTTGLSGPFDLITMFDVLHDIAHPEVVLAEVRRALAPGGVCVVVEANSTSDSGPERDLVGTILNATSVLYCIPTAKSWGAEGLGTMGLPEDALSALAADAGFSSIARAAVGDPFNAVYELRP